MSTESVEALPSAQLTDLETRLAEAAKRARTMSLIQVSLVLVAILAILFWVLLNLGLDLGFMQKWFGFIFQGFWTTLEISALSIMAAVVLALLGALGRLSRNPLLYGPATFYVSLVRGTPLLVQIFFIYLALPQLKIAGIAPNGIILPGFLSGVTALSLNYGAYMTEIFRAGIQSIGIGQREAAYALGMTYGQMMRRVVLPQALRLIIPPTGNEFIAMLKDSALVSVTGAVWELTFRAQKIGRQYFHSLETLIVAAALYWIMTIVFQSLQERLERYLARSERA
jgi:polar amino acid transport system permease protein